MRLRICAAVLFCLALVGMCSAGTIMLPPNGTLDISSFETGAAHELHPNGFVNLPYRPLRFSAGPPDAFIVTRGGQQLELDENTATIIFPHYGRMRRDFPHQDNDSDPDHPSSPIAAVPEPGTLALLVTGAVGLLGLTRTKLRA